MRHIKNDDFQLIQIGLDENLRPKDIASIIEKDDRAVSRHIKKYRVFKTAFKNENNCFNCGSCEKVWLAISSVSNLYFQYESSDLF